MKTLNSLRLTGLTLPVDAPEETALRDAVTARLGVRPEDLGGCKILRRSLDARRRYELKHVYTVAVSGRDGGPLPTRGSDATRYEPPAFDDPGPTGPPLDGRPVVVGSGPAGLMAGYYLAKKGYRPLIIERGRAVKQRRDDIRDFDAGGPFIPESNYLFGEGGAGAWSDGKLTCRLSGPDVDYVLGRYVECGGKPSLVYEHRPHLGSNRLPMITRNFRRKIEAMGGEYRFETTLEGLDVADGKLRGLHTSGGYLQTAHAFLGIGHSARDTYEMLYAAGVPMRAKPFQLGLRIEQPQDAVNARKYGRPEYLELLGAADYAEVAKAKRPKSRDLFSFCMCAGGWVIPSVSEAGMFCSNGMSNSRHETPRANSGIVATLDPSEFGSDHPLAGVELQRRYERVAYDIGRGEYLTPAQRAADFVAGNAPAAGETVETSYKRGSIAADLSRVVPPPILRALREGLPAIDAKWGGKFLEDAVLVGPEMRGSSPVRIDRDHASFQSPAVAGLYPIGEGAGYAGGIVTAAVDGLRAARALVRTASPAR